MSSGAEVVVDHVSKSFEDGRIRALDDVSFRLEPGDVVSLTGPSGGGKSTLLNLIGALDKPDSGSIAVGGERLEELARPVRLPRRDRRLRLPVPPPDPDADGARERAAADDGPRARPGRARGAGARAARGLRDRAPGEGVPSTLSGGERQRVAIARALANGPRLLLADEPTGALDSATGAQIVELLLSLRERRGMTILLVTNDDDVAELADRTLRIRDGTCPRGRGYSRRSASIGVSRTARQAG